VRRSLTCIATIRIKPDAVPGRRITLLPLQRPSEGEAATRRALRRLLLILDHDLIDCTCADGDVCPACDLRQSLRWRARR
jgi:hypothetical protein